MRETDGMVQVWCVKSCLIILFCQVCNVRSESDRGGGYNQHVKLDTDQVFSGQLAVSGVLNRQNGNESGNIRHNQRIRPKSSTRDAKCKFSSPNNSTRDAKCKFSSPSNSSPNSSPDNSCPDNSSPDNSSPNSSSPNNSSPIVWTVQVQTIVVQKTVVQ